MLNANSKSYLSSDNPIGVFDSGMGGLTVLKALKNTLPYESFIYLGDTARLPYGTKSVATVRQYAMQMARILVERQVKSIVIACNTATTAALAHLKSMLPNVPVMGVIEPGAQTAAKVTQNHRIAVLATETTIQSSAYQLEINKYLPEAQINARACSVLVALAEEGMIDNNVAKEALRHYLDTFKHEDTILLGCTHFPVFKSTISNLVDNEIKIVDSADTAAKALVSLLTTHELLNSRKNQGKIQYLVTDSIKRFQSVGEIFLGEQLRHNDITLIDINCS